MTSPAQFFKKLDAFAGELAKPQAALAKTGMAGKQIFAGAAASAGILGQKPVGKRKLVSAYYDVTKDGRGVLIGYRGAVHLVANPTRPHDILPRRPRGSRRRRGASALTINGNVRASARHPGTKGKPFAKEAKATAIRTLPAVLQKAAISEPLKKAFR